MEALNFIIGLVIIGIILVAYTTYLLMKWWESYLGKKRFNKGNIAECKAKKLLKKNGFKILEEQYPLKHQFKINDQLITVDLAVDYLVEHKGVKYLAEVKSGKSAGRVQHKDTRRQLIEYHVINPFDGLLLVDMEYKTIQQVEF